MLCIDEEGRDRTPKPLVAARPHGAGDALPNGWGGSEGLTPGGGGDSNSDRASILSFAPLLGSSGLPTARSFLAGSDTEPSREPSLDGSIVHLGHAGGSSIRPSVTARMAVGATLSEYAAATAAAGRQTESGSQAAQLSISLQDVGRPEQHGQRGSPGQQQQQGASGRQEELGQQGHRSKASQCQVAARSSRGTQVLPWELQTAGGAANSEPADGDATGGHSGGHDGAELARMGAEEDEEEALLALRYPGGAGHEHAGASRQSGRVSPTMSHAGDMLSAEPSLRGSLTGSARGDAYSRRSSVMGELREAPGGPSFANHRPRQCCRGWSCGSMRRA